MFESIASAPPCVARSPIEPVSPVVEVAGWEICGRRSRAGLRLVDETPMAKVQVKAPWDGVAAGALAVPCGCAECHDSAHGHAASRLWDVPESDGVTAVVGSAPGEWLVLATPGSAPAVVARLSRLAGDAADSELVSVVDLTHGRALVRLTGQHSARLLAKVCAIDLSDRVTPEGTAFRSSVAGVTTDVIYQKCGSSQRAEADAGKAGRDAAVSPAPRISSYLLHCERSSGQYLFDALLDAGGEFDIDIDGFVNPEVAP